MTISAADLSTRIEGLLAQTIDHEALFERLLNGHKLITANSRLSRILTADYNQWRIDRGDSQWPSPSIQSWNHWLSQFWEGAALEGLPGTELAVPGNRQLSSLWETTLKQESISRNLLRPESLASQLIATRKLIIDWQLDMDDQTWLSGGNENTAAFYQWNRAFEQRCRQSRWISPEERTAVLSRLVGEGLLVHKGDIDLLGFDEINPAQALLLSRLIRRGTHICLLEMQSRQDQAMLLKCADDNDEIRQAVRWARYWYEKEPDSSIAIVVHNLQEKRAMVERHLQEILTPGKPLTGHPASPWNISMGEPLARVPMIESAFDLLALLDRYIDIQDVGRVLRSPWLNGSEKERNSRALLEKCLREKYPRQLKLREIRYRSTEIRTHDHRHQPLAEDQHEPQTWNSPLFARILDNIIQFERTNKQPRPASAWAESFEQLLLSLGWPGLDEASYEAGDEPQSAEHSLRWQTWQAWRDALRELASLDATVAKLGRKSAISQLRRICLDKVFQAKSAPASIQVLGLYEVSGLRFDHLWVAGLHNENWPLTARPDPFIPGHLQVAASSPRSTPQRELQVARVVTRRLLETAPHSIFSYPGQVEGETALPSPLLRGTEFEIADQDPCTARPPLWLGEDWCSLVASADQPSHTPLSMPGPLTHNTSRGGSSILKHQALCPFRAFASNRLGADELETPVDGISAMLHGSLVHSVLELFWTETQNLESLLKLDEPALQERVRKHVETVTAQDRGLDQRPAFRQVEAERVYRHVLDYLALEKTREPFEVIGFEQEILPDIHAQSIRLIIDRIDRLPSGEEIIIDYKTGKVEPGKWFGDRPEDPQLPLYAISANQTPAAVVFGIIRDDGCLYKGVVKRQGLLPGLPPKARRDNQYLLDAGQHMADTIETWRQVLHQLMADFLAGQATITPKDGRKTCNNSYCKLQSLCRIGELEQIQKTQTGVST